MWFVGAQTMGIVARARTRIAHGMPDPANVAADVNSDTDNAHQLCDESKASCICFLHYLRVSE